MTLDQYIFELTRIGVPTEQIDVFDRWAIKNCGEGERPVEDRRVKLKEWRQSCTDQ